MKKGNKERVLRGIGRIVLKFILSTCLSILFIYLLVGDATVFEMLFSSDKAPEIILLISLVWFFGTIVGALISSVEFINLLAKRNVQLEEKQAEINKLKNRLNRFSKKSANSFADRMFTEIENVNGIDTNTPDTTDADFKTLQELQANKHNSDK